MCLQKLSITNSHLRICKLKPILLLPAFLACTVSANAWAELTPCKNNIAPDQQSALGTKAADQVYKQMPVLPDSSPVTQYVQALGAKLAAKAPGYKWPYKFHVANVAEINAFALPGGNIFVNLGTIQAATDEAQLAAVMSHEISHVVLQHSVCNAVKQQKMGLIAGIGQIAAGMILGGAAGQLAAQGIGMGAGLSFLKMSRGAEKEADLEGVRILYDAGYDPRAMSQFFETLQAKYGEGSSQFLSDHPNPGNRTEYVNKEVETLKPRQNEVTNTPQFASIQKTVTGMHAYTAKEIATGAWRRETPNETVANGVNQDARVQNVDLSAPTEWSKVQGNGFEMAVPSNWEGFGGKDSALIGPAGGIARSAEGGAGNVIYGVLTDIYQPERSGNIDSALKELLDNVARDNPGLTAGTSKAFTANGLQGRSVECNNPSANNGKGEHEWIVAFPQNDGRLRYFAFVAPSSDFSKMRPVYNQMAQSISPR